MSEGWIIFGVASMAAIPLGLLTNFLFHKFHRPAPAIYLSQSSGWRFRRNRFNRLYRMIRRVKVPKILVCTDGSFINTAVFLLAAIEASKQMPEADLTIKHIEWDNLKHVFGRKDNIVAYMNRRHLTRVDAPITVWSNLTVFKGYALLGRPEDFAVKLPTLAAANARLLELSRTRKLTIITNGADSADVLNTPLTPALRHHNIRIEIDPPADALERFLRGRGDLFISGLPQTLEGKRAGMVEVMSSENHPLMFGINSMVYEELRVPDTILEQIATSWSVICRRLKRDEEYARQKYKEWAEIAREVGSDICFPEDDFVRVTYGEPGRYIDFFTNRDDSAQELLRATELIMDDDGAYGLTASGRRKALRALHEIYLGQSDR